MSTEIITTSPSFKKSQISDTVTFAIENIPTVDKQTLEKFLQLLYTTGTFGEIPRQQIINKMRLTMKYIPDACAHSLLVVAELLELRAPSVSNVSAAAMQAKLAEPNASSPRLNDSTPAQLNH